MSKAEERALEAYPKDIEEYVDVNGIKSVVDNNSWQRTIFLKGYNQAEEDLDISWVKEVSGVKEMSRAEEEALKAYPPRSIAANYDTIARRDAFEFGYLKAEKDNELTWEDIKEICVQSVLVEIDLGGLVSDERHYTEVLKRFKDFKERKEK